MRNDNQGQYNPEPRPRKSNAGLIVLFSALFTILMIVVVFLIPVVTNAINSGEKSQPPVAPTSVPATSTQVVYQPVMVNQTMYISNCKTSVTLRVGPGAEFDEIRQIPYGDAVFVLEYTTNDFAQVEYAGNRGYVMRDYIVNSKPQIWTYNEYDVENFVENSLRAFVYGINTGDSSYVDVYFSGNAAKEELTSHKSISDAVQQEILHEVDCHSVTRISPSQVTVIRDSLIEVIYNDGSVKNIPERYQYTVDISGSNFKIVGLKSLN